MSEATIRADESHFEKQLAQRDVTIPIAVGANEIETFNSLPYSLVIAKVSSSSNCTPY